MFTSSGRHIQILDKRFCQKCNVFTDQVCHRVQYEENPDQPGTLLKESSWVCPTCLTESVDAKVQLLPGDKVKIINRLLKMQGDYDIRSMNISSESEKLTVEIVVKD